MLKEHCSEMIINKTIEEEMRWSLIKQTVGFTLLTLDYIASTLCICQCVPSWERGGLKLEEYKLPDAPFVCA
jgi:hypothetical protein